MSAANASSSTLAFSIHLDSCIAGNVPRRHNEVNGACAEPSMEAPPAVRHPLCMIGTKGHTFIRAWRKHRDLTLEQLAENIGITHGHLSKIERGERPYKQHVLEAIARELHCTPADLLSRDPKDPEGIWSLWDVLSPPKRRQLVAIGHALVTEG
jgi:DNA-binding Xre family transcriptional regulator